MRGVLGLPVAPPEPAYAAEEMPLEENLEGLNPEDGMEEARRIVELSSVARDVWKQ